ncbi:MAG: hypothetical protein MZV63_65925 [Marinilabiliales bacterium]|nr:hypothetical protein [Marinilabiliales bacterium]
MAQQVRGDRLGRDLRPDDRPPARGGGRRPRRPRRALQDAASSASPRPLWKEIFCARLLRDPSAGPRRSRSAQPRGAESTWVQIAVRAGGDLPRLDAQPFQDHRAGDAPLLRTGGFAGGPGPARHSSSGEEARTDWSKSRRWSSSVRRTISSRPGKASRPGPGPTSSARAG